MSTAIATRQDVVLEAVVARLLAQITTLNARTCFVSMFPDVPIVPPGPFFCKVSAGSGDYDDGIGTGAGIEGVVEDARVIVTLFTRVRLDETGHDLEALTHATRGLLILKQKVLKALAQHDLLDTAGNALLRDFMRPIGSDAPTDSENPEVAALSVVFSTNFDWDLAT